MTAATLARLNVRVSGVPFISDSDTTFVAQVFTGLSYKATPATTLHVGVKYLSIEGVNLFGLTGEVGEDFALTAGVSFKF